MSNKNTNTETTTLYLEILWHVLSIWQKPHMCGKNHTHDSSGNHWQFPHMFGFYHTHMELLEISVFYQASSRAGHQHLKIHSAEKSNKCNQCDYASTVEKNWTNVSSVTVAGHFRRHLKTYSGEKSNKCNQVTLHPHRHAIWVHR